MKIIPSKGIANCHAQLHGMGMTWCAAWQGGGLEPGYFSEWHIDWCESALFGNRWPQNSSCFGRGFYDSQIFEGKDTSEDDFVW